MTYAWELWNGSLLADPTTMRLVLRFALWGGQRNLDRW
jgi:hypothetical protein